MTQFGFWPSLTGTKSPSIGSEESVISNNSGSKNLSPMITGAHSIIYSRNPEADRTFLRDILKLPHVDVGHGWLIFGLPLAEVAVHPSEKNDMHELYLMCDDVKDFVTAMKEHNISCNEIQDQGWGVLTHLSLPGGGKLGIYQPRHARPKSLPVARKQKRKSLKKKTKR